MEDIKYRKTWNDYILNNNNIITHTLWTRFKRIISLRVIYDQMIKQLGSGSINELYSDYSSQALLV